MPYRPMRVPTSLPLTSARPDLGTCHLNGEEPNDQETRACCRGRRCGRLRRAAVVRPLAEPSPAAGIDQFAIRSHRLTSRRAECPGSASSDLTRGWGLPVARQAADPIDAARPPARQRVSAAYPQRLDRPPQHPASHRAGGSGMTAITASALRETFTPIHDRPEARILRARPPGQAGHTSREAAAQRPRPPTRPSATGATLPIPPRPENPPARGRGTPPCPPL